MVQKHVYMFKNVLFNIFLYAS